MFENEGFEAVGGGGVMWDRSTHYLNPSRWLPYFQQRVFSKETNIKKGIGINIMFDGSNDGLENRIPFLTCGILEFSKDKVSKCNGLYLAGWIDEENTDKEFNEKLCTTTFIDGLITTTYFLPLEILSCKENVNKYIIKPLLLMYDGEFNQANSCVNDVALELNQIIGEVHI